MPLSEQHLIASHFYYYHLNACALVFHISHRVSVSLRVTTSLWARSVWMASPLPHVACHRCVSLFVQAFVLCTLCVCVCFWLCAFVLCCRPSPCLLLCHHSILLNTHLNTLTHKRTQVEVKFDIDANGILSVTATDKGSGKKQDIKITGVFHKRNISVCELEFVPVCICQTRVCVRMCLSSLFVRVCVFIGKQNSLCNTHHNTTLHNTGASTLGKEDVERIVADADHHYCFQHTN